MAPHSRNRLPYGTVGHTPVWCGLLLYCQERGMDHALAVELNRAIGATNSISELVAITRRENAKLNLVNCVTSLQRAAKLAHSDEVIRSLGHLTDRAAQCFSTPQSLQTRHISGTLWACAKLRLSPPELLQAVLQCGSKMRPDWFKPVELSMAVWAVGKLGLGEDSGGVQFVTALLPSAFARAGSFDSQGLSNIATGLAALPPNADATHRLLLIMRSRLAEFTPQEVANTLSAFARLGAQLDACDGFAASAAAAVERSLDTFSTQQLANAAWAATKLTERSKAPELDFWSLFALAVERRVGELNPQELSMVSWSAAQATSSGRG